MGMSVCTSMLSTPVLDCMGHGTDMRMGHAPLLKPDWRPSSSERRTVGAHAQGIDSSYLAVKNLDCLSMQVMLRSIYGDGQGGEVQRWIIQMTYLKHVNLQRVMTDSMAAAHEQYTK